MKGLIAVSVYDRNYDHCLYMSTEYLEWINKYHMVYCNVQKKMVKLDFFMVIFNDKYNFSMGYVTVADQLQNQYHFDLNFGHTGNFCQLICLLHVVTG